MLSTLSFDSSMFPIYTILNVAGCILTLAGSFSNLEISVIDETITPLWKDMF